MATLDQCRGCFDDNMPEQTILGDRGSQVIILVHVLSILVDILNAPEK